MSIEQRFLIPTHKGSIVRDPFDMSILEEKGNYKFWTGARGRYWKRRVKDGSVYIGKPQINKKK